MLMTDEPDRRPDTQQHQPVSDRRPESGRQSADEGRGLTGSGPALAVETYVTEKAGRWVVEIAVMFEEGAVHRTVNDYKTRRHAEIAAQWIKRGANRDIEGPVNG